MEHLLTLQYADHIWHETCLRQHCPLSMHPALLQEGTTKLLEAANSTPENGREAAPDGAQLLHDPALLRAWQAVRFVSCAAKAIGA